MLKRTRIPSGPVDKRFGGCLLCAAIVVLTPLLMGAAAEPSVAAQWLIVIGLLLVSGIGIVIVAALGIAFLGVIAYYGILLGTIVTMFFLSNQVASDLLDQLGPGRNLWWLTSLIAAIGVFLPVLKALRNHVDADPVGFLEKAKAYAPLVLIIVCLPLSLYVVYQEQIQTVTVGDTVYCTNCPVGWGRWFLMFLISVVVTAAMLGMLFVFLHGGVTALLGSVALLVHNLANGHDINLMMFFDTLVGVIDEFFSIHLPAFAALIWSFISAMYTGYQFWRE